MGDFDPTQLDIRAVQDGRGWLRKTFDDVAESFGMEIDPHVIGVDQFGQSHMSDGSIQAAPGSDMLHLKDEIIETNSAGTHLHQSGRLSAEGDTLVVSGFQSSGV